MNGKCENCGGRLESFEGQTYCPDCTYFDALELAEEADEEARREREQPAPAWVDGADDEYPW